MSFLVLAGAVLVVVIAAVVAFFFAISKPGGPGRTCGPCDGPSRR
jgi:hypothetical protein